jgi:hypothetical protein
MSGADQSRIMRVVYDWCEAHNKWKINKLRLLYAPEMVYFGKKMSAEKCLAEKSVLFRPSDYYAIKLASNLDIKAIGEDIYRCDFIRTSEYGREKTSGWMYLLIRFHGLDPEIIAESDSISDRSEGFNPDSVATVLISEAGSIPQVQTGDDNFWDILPYLAALATLLIGGVIIFLLDRKRKKSVSS